MQRRFVRGVPRSLLRGVRDAPAEKSGPNAVACPARFRSDRPLKKAVGRHCRPTEAQPPTTARPLLRSTRFPLAFGTSKEAFHVLRGELHLDPHRKVLNAEDTQIVVQITERCVERYYLDPRLPCSAGQGVHRSAPGDIVVAGEIESSQRQGQQEKRRGDWRRARLQPAYPARYSGAIASSRCPRGLPDRRFRARTGSHCRVGGPLRGAGPTPGFCARRADQTRFDARRSACRTGGDGGDQRRPSLASFLAGVGLVAAIIVAARMEAKRSAVSEIHHAA